MVDPAYSVATSSTSSPTDGMRCTGVLATHYHADHVGGALAAGRSKASADLLERVDVPMHVQRDEVPWVTRAAGLEDANLVAHDSGDVVTWARSTVRAGPHARPHAREPVLPRRAGDWSRATRCSSTAAGGPTCPAATPSAMYESLTTRLAAVPDDTDLVPGPPLLARSRRRRCRASRRRTSSSRRARPSSGWRCSGGDRRPPHIGSSRSTRRHRRRHRGVPGRPAGRRRRSARWPSGPARPDRRGAPPPLRPAAPVQAGPGRDVGAGEARPDRRRTRSRTLGIDARLGHRAVRLDVERPTRRARRRIDPRARRGRGGHAARPRRLFADEGVSGCSGPWTTAAALRARRARRASAAGWS